MNKDFKRILYPTLFLVGCIAIIISIHLFRWQNTWTVLQIHPLSPPFSDMRSVQGALDSIKLGLDPQITNDGDPWNRPMNYPMIWVKIANIFDFDNEQHFITFVESYIALYVAACVYLLIRYPSVWLLLGLFSGSSLFAAESGNNDLIVFSLLFLAAIVPVAVSGSIILFATTLKIYPIFAILSIVRSKLIFSVTLLLGIALMYFGMDEILKIRQYGLFASGVLSYGGASIAELSGIEELFDSVKIGMPIAPFLINLLLVISTIIVFLNKRIRALIVVDKHDDQTKRLFLTGASIYVLTFIFSSNWDYRLIFLLLCVPYLLQINNKVFRLISLSLVLIASNQYLLLNAFDTIGFSLNIISKCLLFVIILGLGFFEIYRFIPGLFIRPVIDETTSHSTKPAT
jgi:hypothetical protein